MAAAIATSAPQTVTSKWHIEDQQSQLDDAQTFGAALDSSNMLRNDIGALEAATLFVQCEDGKLNVYVAWPSFMGDEERKVRWKFDGDAATEDSWTGAVLGTATFAPKPYDFLAALAGAKHFVIDAPRPQQPDVEAVFETTGADKIAAAALAACPKP